MIINIRIISLQKYACNKGNKKQFRSQNKFLKHRINDILLFCRTTIRTIRTDKLVEKGNFYSTE